MWAQAPVRLYPLCGATLPRPHPCVAQEENLALEEAQDGEHGLTQERAWQDAPAYFNRVCGADNASACDCMQLCVPLWVGDGRGSWKDPLRPTVFFGDSITKVWCLDPPCRWQRPHGPPPRGCGGQ
jgi:hypothetical protein